MSTLNKKGPKSGGIYLALAFCVLLVACVGIYSLLVNIFTDMPELENSQKTSTIISQKIIPKEESPIAEQPSSIEKSDSKPVSTAPSPIYTKPINGEIQKGFSENTLVFSDTMNDYRTHNGIDISANIGDSVVCFTRGVIESIEDDPLMGKSITVDHSNGLKSVYRNLAEDIPDAIEVGAEIETGTVIGAVGETALIECSEDPHLHFEIIENNNYISPEEYFN